MHAQRCMGYMLSPCRKRLKYYLDTLINDHYFFKSFKTKLIISVRLLKYIEDKYWCF